MSVSHFLLLYDSFLLASINRGLTRLCPRFSSGAATRGARILHKALLSSVRNSKQKSRDVDCDGQYSPTRKAQDVVRGRCRSVSALKHRNSVSKKPEVGVRRRRTPLLAPLENGDFLCPSYYGGP